MPAKNELEPVFWCHTLECPVRSYTKGRLRGVELRVEGEAAASQPCGEQKLAVG